MDREIAPGYPSLAYNGRLTFAGVLRKYFVVKDNLGRNTGISAPWKSQNTVDEYIHFYEGRIIPAIKFLFGNEKPMESYRAEDFLEILKMLRNDYHFSDDTIKHLRYLIWAVYRAGFENNEYEDNIFWDDDISCKITDDEKSRVNIMTKIRRSFTVSEQGKLLNYFKNLDYATASGQDIGLMLMFTTGLRNNEICGLNWSNFHPLKFHDEAYVVEVLQTTKFSSTELKIGGKTKNAPRIIPLITPVADFLCKRLQFIKDFESANFSASDTEKYQVENFPVVCKDADFNRRCSTDDITRAGRALFKNIGIEKRRLAVLNDILLSTGFEDLLLTEKDSTTYLFRRNFATMLYHIGFSSTDCQYLMGHNIEDDSITRNSFSDPDIIYRLWLKIQKLSEIWHLSEPSYLPSTFLPRETLELDSDNIYVEKDSDSPPQHLVLEVRTLEPGQSINIKVSSNCLKSLNVTSFPKSESFSDSAVITKQIGDAFHKH